MKRTFALERKVFCGRCKKETAWTLAPAFTRFSDGYALVGVCSECGEAVEASGLSAYDRRMRYMNQNKNKISDPDSFADQVVEKTVKHEQLVLDI